jgi:putative oxidoreductase
MDVDSTLLEARRSVLMTDTPTRAALRNYALVPLRLIVGCGFMAHGIAKWSRGPASFSRLLDQIGVPMPLATAWLVTLLEVFGGLAILVGLFVSLVSIPLIASTLVAMLTVQIHYGFSSVNTIGLTDSGPVFGPPGYEINLLYIASLIALALLGPSRLSVDEWLARRRSRAR